MARVGVVLGIAVFTCAPSAFGQNCPEQMGWVGTGYSGGFAEPFLMEGSGSIVYVVGWYFSPDKSSGNIISIIDASDPEGPHKVGQIGEDIRGGNNINVTDIGVSDGGFFFINRSDRVDFIDASDPSNPVHISGYYPKEGDTPPVDMSEIEVLGDFLYIASSGGLTILNVSDIESPAEVGIFEYSWEPSDLVVGTGYAFVTESEIGLHIIDVSDPEQPFEIGYWPATWEAHDLEVSDDVAYVSTGNDGLRIIDVADHANPVEVAIFEIPGGVGSISVEGPLAVAVVSEGVSIIDVSTPENPKEVDLYTTNSPAWEAVLSDRTVYVAVRDVENLPDSADGLRVVDVTFPDRPTELASIDFVPRAMDVAVSEDTMYTAHGDMGISAKHTEGRGWLDTPGFARSVTPYGQYLLVADDHKGLRIIDTSDPSRLVEVGYVDTQGQAQRVVVARDHAYVADGDGGLRIIDISSPTSPEEVGFLETPGQAVDVGVSDDCVYLANGPDQVRVIDVSNPAQPFDRTSESALTRYGVRALVVAEQSLFMAFDNSLESFDISDPFSPEIIGGVCCLGGISTEVVVSGSYASVSNRSTDHGSVGGVDVIDITDPGGQLSRVGRWDYSGDATGLAVSNGDIYVSTGDSGVQALDTRCLTTYWVELVAHQSGMNGSEWRSDVLISPRWDWVPNEASLEFRLHTVDGVYTGDAAIPRWSIGVFEDIVGLLGYEGKGALEIQSAFPLWVSSRVYNLTDSGGTVGGFFPGYRSSESTKGFPQEAYLYGLRQQSGRFRTNISVTNTSTEVQKVRIYLFSADGTKVASYPLSVDPGMTVQDVQPFKNRANRPNLGWGSAKVWVAYGSNRSRGILTSATVIDSRTNDAVVVPMVLEKGVGTGKR